MIVIQVIKQLRQILTNISADKNICLTKTIVEKNRRVNGEINDPDES